MELSLAVVFSVSCLLSLGLTRLSMTFASRVGMLDKPDARKIHTTATPRLGGFGIVVAALVCAIPAILLAGAPQNSDAATILTGQKMYGILLGTLCIFAVGLCDDLFGVSSKIKLIALIAASCAVCGAGATFAAIRTDGNVLLSFPNVSWLATILWIVGIAVAFNFIDGLDGLAGGLGLISSLVLAAFLIASGHYIAAMAPVALAGSIVGFLYFNWHPARTFMGDCGSMTIGFLIGALTVATNPLVGTMRGMIIPVLGVSVAMVDAAITLFRRRYQQRRSMFSAERGHIHHRLLDRGLKHHQVVIVIHGVSILAVLLGTIALSFDGWATFGGLVLVVPLLGVLFHSAGSVQTTEMIEALRRKRSHDRSTRRFEREFEALQLEFDAADTFEKWWQVTCAAADRLEFSSVEIPVDTPYSESKTTYRWCNAEPGPEEEHLDARIPVTLFGADKPSQVASVRVPSAACLESAGKRLALFSRLLAENGRESLRNIHNAERSKALLEKMIPTCELGKVRVAIVHDFYDSEGGPRHVLEQLVDIFTHADLFGVTDFVPAHQRDFIHEKHVATTFVQRLPFAKRRPFLYSLLMPLAIEQLDLSPYDLVISSSQFVAKGVTTGPDQLHICYCHAPLNYGRDFCRTPGQFYGSIARLLASLAQHRLRNWDFRASNSVDQFIANSSHGARRIEKLYRRSATVIGPPVDTETFLPAADAGTASTDDDGQSYYLAVSRFVPPGRIEVLVDAFAQSPERKLIVIGDGTQPRRLRRRATSNIDFLGPQDAVTIVGYMQRARAFVTATDDDDPLTLLEAHACGLPVIVLRTGCIAEFIKESPMGCFFDEPTAESLLEALDRFDAADTPDALDRKAARQRVERLATEQFVEQFTDVVRREIRARWGDRLEKPAAIVPVNGLPTLSNESVQRKAIESST